MSKVYDPEDPIEIEKWTRHYYGIVDESVESYLVRNGFSADSSLGVWKRLTRALAWIKPQVTPHSQSIFDELTALMDAHQHSITPPAVEFPRIPQFKFEAELHTEALVLNAKFELLFNQAIALHRLQPALDAQNKYKTQQSQRASKPRKLDDTQRQRIARQYWANKKDGESYGAAKALAAAYNVSETTIHTIAKKHKPGSIDK